MTLELHSIQVRSTRRLRLKYTNALAAGAYASRWFTVQCLDGSTSDPQVVAALLVPDATDELELALGIDLSQGGEYQLTSAANIPGLDGSLTALDVTAFRPPLARQAPSPSVSSSDVQAVLYGEDVAHDGRDMVETPDGDLAVATGPENAMTAVTRRLLADGLPYNADYGPHLRRFVDAPAPSIRAARGSVERQARLDDRVKTASVTVLPDDNSGDLTLQGTIGLIGGVKRSFNQSVT